MRIPILSADGLHARQIQAEAAAHNGASAFSTMARSLFARAECKDGSNGDASQTCGPKPQGSDTTAIVVGSCAAIAIACVVIYFIHRRKQKKNRIEEANDPHKSLDFGLDMPSASGKTKKKFGKGNIPEMTITDLGNGTSASGKKDRGLSMDMSDMESPYLPPQLMEGSKESLHSMSRLNTNDVHDPYRPVTMLRNSHDNPRSPRPFDDNGSVYSNSTMRTGDGSSLLANAQRMSQSHPKRGDSVTSEEASTRQMHSARGMPPSRMASQASSEKSLLHISESSPASPEPLPPLPPQAQPESPEPRMPPPRKSSMPSASAPPRKSSISAAQTAATRHASESSFYGEEFPAPPLPPKVETHSSMMATPVVQEPEGYDSQYDVHPDMIQTGRFSIDDCAPSQQLAKPDNRTSVMGLRPLPREDPQENAEQRANRIRSFYKEYFDDSRPGPGPARGGYYEDTEFYGDSAIYDPDTGGYIMPGQAPFAQPMGRRAMTPPPRSGPRFAGADMHRRQHSTMSAGRGQPRGRPPVPKKQLPPPKALTSLPTPHKLREDTALIINPIDFAPPASFRDAQAGRRPDSPMGIQRPYSPSVKAFSPLVAAFDDLVSMPSPHHLRKSGAFSGLDFAPPGRLNVPGDSASDAGSIRSARSGISAVQMDAVRAGAYRVSRIPKEMVTTREDLSAQLRPKMDLISRA